MKCLIENGKLKSCRGSAEQFAKIKIKSKRNEKIFSANFHYNYED